MEVWFRLAYKGFSGSGDVATTMKFASDHNWLAIRYHQSGGSGVPQATDLPGILKVSEGLAAAAANAPVSFQIELTRYESLPSWQGIPKTVATAEVDRIARRYGQFASLREDVEAILANPTPYILNRGVTIQNLKDIDDHLLTHIQRLKQDAQTCVDSYGQNCHIDPADDVSDYGIRIQMPITSQAFGVDQAIANSTLAINFAVDQLKSDHGDHPAFDQSANNIIQTNKALIAQAQASYATNLKQAIGLKWISSVVKERCRLDPNSPDCLSNSQTDAWIAQIVTK